jgi:hypothetical protein
MFSDRHPGFEHGRGGRVGIAHAGLETTTPAAAGAGRALLSDRGLNHA